MKINLGWGSVGGGCSWIVRMCVLAEERKVSCERITLHGEASLSIISHDL